jgi:alkylation response protein AidB-like acyl-CoA dehydrogenase
VNLDLSDDELALQEGVRKLCDGRFPIDRVRGGFDRSVWTELAEFGVFDPELTCADRVVIMEELGRALVPGPVVWGCLAAPIGIDGVVGGIEPREPLVVEHLGHLDALLVLTEDEIRRVEPAALHGEELEWPLDALTPLTRVGALPDGEHVGDADAAVATRRTGAVLTAGYLVGMAAAASEQAVTYARERRQFDRPIGSFQAIKHILADMLAHLEVARAAVYAGAAILDDPEDRDVDRAVAAAKTVAGETALANCRASIQVHGGMGFTWEVDAHLYLKRAWVLDTVFGSTTEHARVVFDSLAR